MFAGSVIRPFWYIWEDGSFWKLTGAWSVLKERLAQNPEFEMVIDTCDLDTRLCRMTPDDIWTVDLTYRPAWPDRA